MMASVEVGQQTSTHKIEAVRSDWTCSDPEELYFLPLLNLFRAQAVHRRGFDPSGVGTAAYLPRSSVSETDRDEIYAAIRDPADELPASPIV